MSLVRRSIEWALPVILWLWLFCHLQAEWTLNAQYNYGWVVPFLALLLFFLRWQTRPLAQPGRSNVVARICSLVLLVALLPIRIVEEANPDWRFLSWTLALVVVAFSLLFLAKIGSRPWAVHFAFPVCFPLVAVPWPVQFENAIVHGLMHAVASVAVEVAGWLGLGAYQLGNVIQLANGFVGVDEACSGVKTLQTGIMVSLFLGELLELTIVRRLVLLAFGCVWVFACNIFRATALVVIAGRKGIPALQHWHDPIGIAVLVLGMGGIAGTALAFSRKRRATVRVSDCHPPLRVSAFTGTVFGLVWVALIFATSELWYRAHERELVDTPKWEVHWPADAKKMPIASATSAILRFDEASSAIWRRVGTEKWWGFVARWQPKRAALQLVRSHSPEICLPAVGRDFRRELPAVMLDDGGLHLKFRAYEFAQEGRPLFVYVAIQEDKVSVGDADSATAEEWNARGRLRAAWNGRRNLGQRLLELAVVGFRESATADEGLRQTAREILRRDTPTD